MDDEVRNLLVAWNLKSCIEVFKENEITSLSSSDGSLPPSPSLRLPEGYNLEQEEENPDAILWLKILVSLGQPFYKNGQTTRTRLNISKGLSISQYFKEYPALRKSTGYVLLEKDFEELYAGTYTDVFESFSPLEENIFKLAKKISSNHNKDTTLN